jgi:hypothetical protein
MKIDTNTICGCEDNDFCVKFSENIGVLSEKAFNHLYEFDTYEDLLSGTITSGLIILPAQGDSGVVGVNEPDTTKRGVYMYDNSAWKMYVDTYSEDIIAELNQKSNATNLENGTGTGSLVQKRLKSDGVTWTTAKAYQGASTALGGGTQAGRTEEEFNAYFWDSTNNIPLNGGKGKDSNGNILDSNGLTYAKSYSYALAEGESTKALGRSSHAEGNATQSIGNHSHSEGLNTKAEGYAAHSEGGYTAANGSLSHAEGNRTVADGSNSHAEGYKTTASRDNSHAEGSGTTASATNSHAEGFGTVASNGESHAEGNSTIASGLQSHAEGIFTKATGMHAHAEGSYTIAEGENAHAEGGNTKASHSNSHAEGYKTKTSFYNQHVSGQYNKDNVNALFIVGNGESEDTRSNAFEVLKDGRAKVQSAPIENDDVVRKIELDTLDTKINELYVSQEMAATLF